MNGQGFAVLLGSIQYIGCYGGGLSNEGRLLTLLYCFVYHLGTHHL